MSKRGLWVSQIIKCIFFFFSDQLKFFLFQQILSYGKCFIFNWISVSLNYEHFLEECFLVVIMFTQQILELRLKTSYFCLIGDVMTWDQGK